MQWVVTTGANLEEARQRALDVLGIDESELDIEVLEAESTRFFGLRTTPARVRARVRPTRPRPKVDRRTRRTKGNAPSRRRRSRRSPQSERDAGKPMSDGKVDNEDTVFDQSEEASSAAAQGADSTAASEKVERRPKRSKPAKSSEPAASSPRGKEGSTNAMSDISLQEQEPTAVAFVTGLVEAFGATATVTAEHVDDEALEIHVNGDDLGLLVGQRGTTLSSIAELTRTSVAQQHSGRLEGRLRVDIAGYRAKRKEALIRFAGQVAEKVLSDGKSVALEPMSPPDRKIVHDAINDIDGVHTASRGEDRNRHVVVLPD